MALVISYEEYFPYGCSSYHAVRSQTEVPKRYRYDGKERDEETGLGYHRARYYVPWLGRWAGCDPMSLIDGPNVYSAFGANPVRFVDSSGRSLKEVNAFPIDGPIISAAPPFYGAGEFSPRSTPRIQGMKPSTSSSRHLALFLTLVLKQSQRCWRY